ncbi:hypothetical protein FQN57_003847 [Myotisia sp. PD_48]|nr:hypothetical protein FQN57_003847 [Myotisia sp. PD_48]
MDANSHLNSNNVTVEYTDPFGLFPEINSLLSDVLPLRNLHWKSSTRPVRSIDSIHIDFVPSQSVNQEQRRQSDGSGGQQRRHQIPGLRSTPYLKIYFLRCDDSETYKSTSRKLLREWVKSRASISGVGPDNHDAFEWLIVHVIPAESAASESSEKVSTSKWPGRGSTSVLEKVKADFNGSSKPAVDHVGQIRTLKSDADKKKPSDLPAQLDDLVMKLKSAILTSFDSRVRQYEADIREKELQRNLPGWNFCTFFLLKEGLALGFENVGLFEDALIGYDELSAGFDAVLSDLLSGTGGQHSEMFLRYSKDIKAKAEKAITTKSDGSTSMNEENDEPKGGDHAFPNPVALAPDAFPLQPRQKPYRDMILENNISVFDFRVYIFSRQLLLLLKAARSTRTRNASPPAAETFDLALLAEICKRGNQFIAVACRALRQDLEQGLAQSKYRNDSNSPNVIDNIVSSWAYIAVSQILTQTSTNTLETPKLSLRTNKDLVDASVLTPFVIEQRVGVPKRSSSLSPSSPNTGRPIPTLGSIGSYSGKRLKDLKSIAPAAQKAGGVELASARANLFILAKRELAVLGQRRGWEANWHGLSLLFAETSDLTDVSLDDESSTTNVTTTPRKKVGPTAPCGIDSLVLVSAVKSVERYNSLCEKLNDEIFQHCIAAKRFRTAEMAMAGAALLKYNQGDYPSAASFFHQLATFYGKLGWDTLAGPMIEMHGRCLKQLNHKTEFVSSLLKLLKLYASVIQFPPNGAGQNEIFYSAFQSTMSSRVSEYVSDLFETSKRLSEVFTVPIKDFFGNITINPTIRHFEEQDGFQLQFSLAYILGESINIDTVKVRLVNSIRAPHSELWLENQGGIQVKAKATKILVDSSATVQGKFYVDQVELVAGNITFVQNYKIEEVSHVMQDTKLPAIEESRPCVICFPAVNAFKIRVSQSRSINLDGLRTLDLEMKSGWNNITRGSIRLKPNTAGLRLLVHETVLESTGEDSASVKVDDEKTGKLSFSSFAEDSVAVFKIPYSLESNQPVLSIIVNAEYQTSDGQVFSYLDTFSVISTLPVSVNVQDLFQDEQLFSRFTISPGMMIPIRVCNCSMSSSEQYEVESSRQKGEIFTIFPKQPASMLYKIKQKAKLDKKGPQTSQKAGRKGSSTPATTGLLKLVVEFTCLNEECLSVLEAVFEKDIDSSPFRALKRLLLPHLQEVFRTQWTAHDLEVMSLLREIEVLDYERVQWKNVIRHLDEDMQRRLIQWLKGWHHKHRLLHLPDDGNEQGNNEKIKFYNRRITIPVHLPEIQVVHTARLKLSGLAPNISHVGIDEAIMADLTLHHTRRWCHTPAEQLEPGASLEFSYEIICNPDTWIIGGRRRGNFVSGEGETRAFSIVLIAQRAGNLLLPTVEVKSFICTAAASTGGGLDESFAPPQRRLISSELDYQSHGQTVLVTPNLRMTSMDLDGFGEISKQHQGAVEPPEQKTGQVSG